MRSCSSAAGCAQVARTVQGMCRLQDMSAGVPRHEIHGKRAVRRHHRHMAGSIGPLAGLFVGVVC